MSVVMALSLMILLLAAACDSESSPEVPSGETPSTSVDQPDVSAPSSTEAPATTQAPATTAAPSENTGSDTTVAPGADEGGVDPYVVAAIIAVVVLVGVGAWFIGRSGGDTETETTIENPQ